ncbi:MAG: cobalamin biosynthesis protein CbiG [Lachnospiraceae bacterium]|nr:cobalamin biosynthesis protein CbiG [Lachnospiraceae bacterium]
MGKSYKGLNVSIISFTKYGVSLSLEFKDILMKYNCNVKVYTGKGSISCTGVENINCSLREWTGIHFKEAGIIIFIGACGIAVRSIAPFIKSKCIDPAVIVADDMGINVISLLSGHLGKANEWTSILASAINANAVITTSSDIHNKIAIDLFAERNNLYIENMEAARRIQAAVIEEKPVTVFCDAEITGKIPDNFYIRKMPDKHSCDNIDKCNAGNYNIIISPFISFKECHIFNNKENITLYLIPKVVTLGTGCRKSKTYSEINSFIREALNNAGISIHSVSGLATIDIKKNEPGILQFAEKEHLPVSFYSVEELETVTGSTSYSGFVKEITGTGNVCERAALFPQGEKELLLEKQAGNGITIAAAIRKWSVDFG